MVQDKPSLEFWFQAVSNVAIVVGLIIVIVEINQSKQLAYAQLLTDGTISGLDRNVSLMGEDPRTTLAKAAFCPEELTEDVWGGTRGVGQGSRHDCC